MATAEPPPPTENPIAQHIQLIEALYMQINLLAEVRDALRNLTGDRPAPDRTETATGARARK
jgi:hypothetical protein